MLIKFYTDTHIDKAVMVQLRLSGIDSIRCEEVGRAEADDFEHLTYAASEQRSIVTNDQGFTGHHRQWLEAGKHHAGIFLITKDKENIGLIVNTLLFWHEAITIGAADLEKDVVDQIQYLP
ncbi:MAG: DUF5615 family PIN-like protein [Chloroflexota bacterium]